MATAARATSTSLVQQKLSKSPGKAGVIVFLIVLMIGVAYIGLQLSSDLSIVKSPSIYPFLLLGIALLVALSLNSSMASTILPTLSQP